MTPSVAYEKDCAKKEAEKLRNVKYDSHGTQQCYVATETDKGCEDRYRIKYQCGTGAAKVGHQLPSSGALRKCSKSSSSSGGSGHQVAAKTRPASSAATPQRDAQAPAAKCAPPLSGVGYRQLAPTEVAAECYEIRRAPKKYQPCVNVRWQHGKYVRDECGSGVIPVRFDIGPHKRLWCKTPLSMYQATIGELGKQLLCREKVVPRDVWPAPPCNVAEYIMPPCRGYYRKYDCMRPCEEEHAYVQRGKKCYRDRVHRYWEPCLTQQQKHTLNLNEYGPHNAALTLKLRRENMGIPCW